MSKLTKPVGTEDHVLGRADAPVTLVEYGDYECPYCARAYVVVSNVLRHAGDRVRFVARHFPLAQIHPHALLAAQAAEAAAKQGRFWLMHAALFENQPALSLERIVACAEAIELDVPRFESELETGVHLKKVEGDFRSGERSGVTGTPAFFVDGDRLDANWDFDTLMAAVTLRAPRAERAG